jgi:hypothetical protein
MLKYGKQFKKIIPRRNMRINEAVQRHIMTSNKLVASFGSKYSNQSTPKTNYYPFMAIGAMSALVMYEAYKKKLAECCGIIGYVGQDPIAGKLILDGIQILQYRGYDS